MVRVPMQEAVGKGFELESPLSRNMDQSPDLVMASDRVRSCGDALVVPVSGMSWYRPDAEPVAGPIDPIVEVRKDR